MRMCDILNGYTKSDGIHHAIRALSPDVIAVDEIGTSGDEDSLLYALHAGITILATVHGNRSGDFKKNIRRLTREGAFDYYVYLSDKNPTNRVEQIIKLVASDSFGQIFITDTNREHLDRILRKVDSDYRIFEVEHGMVREMKEGEFV